MIERLLRRRPARRRRFRDRVLAAMVAVALVPLAVFAAVVALDLDSVSRNTVADANRSIRQDQEDLLRGQVTERAAVFEQRLENVAAVVRQLETEAATLLAQPPAATASLPFRTYKGAYYVTGADATVFVGQTSALVQGGQFDSDLHASTAAGSTGPLVPLMQTALKSNPDVDALWISDQQDFVLRTVPPIDVRDAVDGHRLDPDAPLGPTGKTFPASESRMTADNEDAGRPGPAHGDLALWTDPYPLLRSGRPGVTVWLPVGGRYRVGADVDMGALTAGLQDGAATGAPGAYPMLLSSSGTLLGGAGSVAGDFGLPAQWVGSRLPMGSSGSPLHRLPSLAAAAPAGHPTDTLTSTLGGQAKELVATPVPAAHWVLATVVPVSSLLPEQAGLARGVETGVHRILLQVVPVAVGLCLLALLLATLLARRLVGPVRALTVAAERLADGHTREPVPAQGNDEVGLLADSLERMRREVNASNAAILAAARELEGRVADRTAELRARNEELVALNALAGSLTRSLDPEAIMVGALTTLRALVPLVVARGYLVVGGRPVRTAAWGTDDVEAVAADLSEVASAAMEAHEPAVRETTLGMLVGLPLETSESTLGALALLASRGWRLSDRTRTLLRAVADQVGLALRTAQLSAEGRELAVLEERTRLAREIHDTLAQQLTAIVLQLEAAEAFTDRDSRRAAGMVVAARDLARSALQEARRSVWNLRPTPLATSGLPNAMALEADRWQARTGIVARVRTDSLPVPLTLSPQSEVALFRITQEALSNVFRHSAASRVDIDLCERDGMLELRISDDGEGFEPGADHPGSFGLVGMRERARLADAELSVNSRPGGGTTVRVRMPLGDGVGGTAVPA